jgi:predicted O-linked N-acetylglucosamine transferase (SPINDLY family)
LGASGFFWLNEAIEFSLSLPGASPQSRGLPLVVPEARWLLAPIPKVASTLLKRLAVIAAGREPPELASVGETRPALVIHRPEVHGLKPFELLSHGDQLAWSADAHAIRLAVTRHPAERLLSFWHDKLHLADPAYAPLNASVQASRSKPASELCRFGDFLTFLDAHWEQLRSDGHLLPQREWLAEASLFNSRIDRDQLVKDLPTLLQPFLDPSRMGKLRQELSRYDELYRQRLGKRWEQAYSKDGFAILERLYGEDLEAYGYRLPNRRIERIRPLAAVDIDALVDPLQQLRERHQQIAGLQQQVQELQKKLRDAELALRHPPLPPVQPGGKTSWPQHNSPEAELGHLYESLQNGRSQEVLDQLKGVDEHPHRGELDYLAGLAHSSLGDHQQALRCYEASQTHNFLTPYVLFNGANACRALGHQEDALRLFREALEQFPGFAECRHNYALALIDVGCSEDAERELRLLLRDQPSYHQAAFCLANHLRDTNRDREALEAFRLCLQYAPTYAEAWNNMGLTHGSLKQNDQAISCYRQALSIDAAFKPSRQNLAQALVQQKHHQEALKEFEIFRLLDTLTSQESVIGLQGQITCLLELDRYEDALAVADSQAERPLRLMARLHVLPVLYASEEQLEQIRSRWSEDASQLYALLDGLTQEDPCWELLYAHAWSLTNFYLAYQMANDRPLQELYAGILDRILRPRLGRFMEPLQARSTADSAPTRVGVISPHLINHNGSIWCLGWLEGIANDPGYEIFSYNLGDVEDSGTQRFAALGTYRHLALRAEQPEPMLQQILDDHLDVLIFTDVGMHPASKIASVLQLAPVQAQGWGHPITSGSKTMGYFISGSGMEPPGNEEHYSETLLRLPSTGLNYETPAAIHDGTLLFEKFGLPMDRPILNSLQSTFKYVPQHDWIFAELALRNPDSLIVLVGHMGHGAIAERLLQRMAPHFGHRGLRVEEHLRILPRLDYADYMGLFSISHHTIDTIDWNGGNSSFQSFSLDCPVVTLPSRFMRGRHTVAMLQVLELQELIAKDAEDYIAISTRLLNDADFYAEMRHLIAERKQRLFRDQTVASAFRDAVDSMVRGHFQQQLAVKRKSPRSSSGPSASAA